MSRSPHKVMMQWMFAVIAVGLSALVNVCQAEEMEMCNEGYASAQKINLTIALTPSTYRCCCHLDFKAAQTVWRRTTVDCGITLVHNVSFLDKNCGENFSISQTVDQNKIALCVVRENGLTQNKSLKGQMLLQAKSYDIDVNCSDPVLVSPSTASTQPGVSEVELTTSTSSGFYIAIAVVVVLLVCIGVAYAIMRITSVFTQTSETGNPHDGVESGNLSHSPDSGYEKLHRRRANREDVIFEPSLSVNGGNRESLINESLGDYERIRTPLEETCEVDTIAGAESNILDFNTDNVYNTVQDLNVLNVVQQSIQCAEERMNHDNDMLGEYVRMNGLEVSSACQEITVKEKKMHTNEKTNEELGDQEMERISQEHLPAGCNKLDVIEEPNKGQGKMYKDRLMESHVVTCKASSNTSDITNEPALSMKDGDRVSQVHESPNDYERIRTHEDICEVQAIPGAKSNSPHVDPDNVYNTVQDLEELPVNGGSGAGVTVGIGDTHSRHNKTEILNVVQQSIQCAEGRMNHDNDMVGEYVKMNGQEVSSACQEITVKENKLHTNVKTNEELGDQKMEMISQERLPAGCNKLDVNEEPNKSQGKMYKDRLMESHVVTCKANSNPGDITNEPSLSVKGGNRKIQVHESHNDYERIRSHEEVCEVQAVPGTESNSPHVQPDNVYYIVQDLEELPVEGDSSTGVAKGTGDIRSSNSKRETLNVVSQGVQCTVQREHEL